MPNLAAMWQRDTVSEGCVKNGFTLFDLDFKADRLQTDSVGFRHLVKLSPAGPTTPDGVLASGEVRAAEAAREVSVAGVDAETLGIVCEVRLTGRLIHAAQRD